MKKKLKSSNKPKHSLKSLMYLKLHVTLILFIDYGRMTWDLLLKNIEKNYGPASKLPVKSFTEEGKSSICNRGIE